MAPKDDNVWFANVLPFSSNTRMKSFDSDPPCRSMNTGLADKDEL